MRTGFENQNIGCLEGVEPYKNITSGGNVVPICRLNDLCGMGMKEAETPNQWWRFISPIFLHAGIVHIVTNLFFQVNIINHYYYYYYYYYYFLNYHLMYFINIYNMY